MKMRYDMSLIVLFFFLPEELLRRYPQPQSLPSCPHEVFHTDRYSTLIASSAFARFIQESYAREAWQSFRFTSGKGARRKIPGQYDDYADSFMLRQLALQACEHIAEKLEQTEYSAQSLSGMAAGEALPRPSTRTAPLCTTAPTWIRRSGPYVP